MALSAERVLSDRRAAGAPHSSRTRVSRCTSTRSRSSPGRTLTASESASCASRSTSRARLRSPARCRSCPTRQWSRRLYRVRIRRPLRLHVCPRVHVPGAECVPLDFALQVARPVSLLVGCTRVQQSLLHLKRTLPAVSETPRPLLPLAALPSSLPLSLRSSKSSTPVHTASAGVPAELSSSTSIAALNLRNSPKTQSPRRFSHADSLTPTRSLTSFGSPSRSPAKTVSTSSSDFSIKTPTVESPKKASPPSVHSTNGSPPATKEGNISQIGGENCCCCTCGSGDAVASCSDS